MPIPDKPTTEDIKHLLAELTGHTFLDPLTGTVHWKIVWLSSWLAGRAERQKLKVNLYGNKDEPLFELP
jgi:hypothetical protein